MTTTLHPFAEAYLGRLRAAATTLPADQAAELVADLTDHLRVALPPGAPDADARRVLDDLGTPEQIVAAASPDRPTATSAASAPSRLKELIALVLLLGWIVGLFFLPLAGLAWLVAVTLLVTSPVWTPLDKALGVVASLLPAGVLLAGAAAFSTQVCPAEPDGTPSCDPNAYASQETAGLVLLACWGVLALYTLVRLARRLLAADRRG